MKGWLIYTKERAKANGKFIEWFLQEARTLGIQLELKMREDILIGVQDNQLYVYPASLPDFAVVRCIDPLFSKQLQLAGVAVFNPPEVAEITNDKARTHQLLAEHNIPMVDTIFTTTERLAHHVPLAYPFIVKDVNGHGGKNVFKVENKIDLQAVFKNLTGDIIVQKLAQQGKDVRVYVLGKEIIGAVLRSSSNDFRSNYTLGGKAEIYVLNEKERALIKKIISLFDFGLVGIDFIFNEKNNFLCNEIEDVVGCRTLSTLTDINIVQRYLIWIKKMLHQ
ncbi:gamma-F420-2:alpha-L-glutamate ligase [Gracilibacillus halotolerans]|uniref:Gamma-F420-2:alpha-L-glutamate ligase n=1 Tax=Gracilibacillus halotolerans TaxID=74386 RepID=A0A841RSM0_9BACI|nr:ATP-grasp domain-containing protein [Gracilibacillus halotolerans]MBB6513568.1 gamma-F420-2:alpha-L-glutamate ligase [Gracilibacillus halotolerans]